MSKKWVRSRAFVVASIVAAGLGGLAASADAKPNDETSYSFTFVNGKVITGVASSNDTMLAGAGGSSANTPTGMTVHVSCSDPFTGGWGQKQGPKQGVDTAWQIASYSITKGSKTCSGNFAPPPPVGQPKIDVEMYVEGDDADQPTGPTIQVPGTAHFTYVVTNTGTSTLRQITLTDQRLGAVNCPKSTLAAGEAMDCSPRSSAVTVAGAATNSATVTGVADSSPAVAPTPAGSKGIGYAFTFVNGKVITGTAQQNDIVLAGAGGSSANTPTGMTVHVSCSDPFTGGWGQKQGPKQGVDTAWQIASYSIIKGNKTCGAMFQPVATTVQDTDPVNYRGVSTPPPPPSNPSSLGDRVWLDQDGNGRQAMAGAGVFTEPGVQGVKVTLHTANGGAVTDLSGKVVAPKSTNTDGYYTFTHLPAGSYLVKFEVDCRYVPTAQMVGEDTRNSDAAAFTTDGGRCVATTGVIVLPAGTNNPHVDFGVKSAT